MGVWSALFLRQPTHPDCTAWQAPGARLYEPVDREHPEAARRDAAGWAEWYQARHADLIALPALAHIEPGRAGVPRILRLLEGV